MHSLPLTKPAELKMSFIGNSQLSIKQEEKEMSHGPSLLHMN
jgi:hypothetical protein